MEKSGYRLLVLMLLLVIVAGTAGCATTDSSCLLSDDIIATGVPPVPLHLKKKFEEYQDWNHASLVGWESDGRGLIVLRRSGEFDQLHRVRKPGAGYDQLTSGSVPVVHAAVCQGVPDAVLFTHDAGGNEQFQISRHDPVAKTTVAVTADSFQNDGIVVARNGRRFAYASNRRNGVDFDLYTATTNENEQHRRLFDAQGAWSVLDWSFDDRILLAVQYKSRTSSRLYLCNADSGTLKLLSDTLKNVSEEVAVFGKSGVFYTSDKVTGFRNLLYRDLQSNRDTLLTKEIPWDVREVAVSHDGESVAFTTNEHGFSGVYIMNASTFEMSRIESLPTGIIGTLRFHQSDSSIAMTITTPHCPEDVYEYEIFAKRVQRWTDNTPHIENADRFLVRVADYAAYDSVAGIPRRIPCVTYVPCQAKGASPVLMVIHGGPESQFWPSFKPEYLFYVNELNVALVAPNVRGSGGYGAAYLSLDDGMQREDAVKDIGACIKWIKSQPQFDAGKIAVSGGSYGGFMALSSLVHYSDDLCAGIDHYGIVNFISFLEKTAPYRRDLRRVEYGDERIPKMNTFLKGISPLHNVDRIKKPLLVVQGANDPRVPLYESEQIVRALRASNQEVWFLIAKNEGHGFRKKETRQLVEMVNAHFLRQHLLTTPRKKSRWRLFPGDSNVIIPTLHSESVRQGSRLSP